MKLKLCPDSSSNMNYEEFQSGEGDDLNMLINNAKTIPFMSKYRLFILKDVDRLKPQEKEILASFIEKKPQSSFLALTSDKLPADDIIAKSALRFGKAMNFELLQGAQLSKWITDKFTEFNKRISPQALKFLIDNTGNDLTRLELEIELLVTFVGKSENIKQTDAEQMIGKSLEVTTYQLVGAIGLKNADLALRLLEGLQKDTRTIAAVLGLTGWHLRRIWRAKKISFTKVPLGRAAAMVGVPYYASSTFLRQAEKFSIKELERGFKALLKLDKDIKSSPVNGYRALELLIIQLCDGRGRPRPAPTLG